MAITVKHKFVSAIPDGTDATIVRPSNWNDDHDLTGTIPVTNGGTGAATASDGLNNLLPSQTGNNGKVLATDGTNASWITNGSGDVVGPSSATDNAIARFDGTTGKLIQNSGVTVDDNSNITANALNDAYTNTAASGTQIVLTVASPRRYTITGSGGQVIKLPDATTLTNGTVFQFDNNQSSGAITVNNNSNTLIVSVPSGGFVLVNLLSNAIAAGSWDRHDQAPSNVSWSTNTFDYAGSFTNGTWNGNVVAYNRGGTGQSSLFVAGGIVYGSTTSALAVTPIGTTGQVLTSAGAGTPTWTTPTTGTVTSVTGTSPVVSSGGNTPAISMPAATSSVNGYLTSADWTTFNSKQPAGTYVTSVAATSPVTSSGGTTPTIAMPAATTSVSGYLTSTDWNTFNNKGSGTVTSVAATVPAFLSVTGSPITSSGTLAIAYSGTALPVANGGTGATTLTGLVIGNGTSAMTTVTAPSGTVVGTTDTQTLTNKAILPRVSSTTSIGSPLAWNSDNFDLYAATAQAGALTISADAGTPADGEKIQFRFTCDATPRVITFTGGASKGFKPIGVTMTVSGSNFTYTLTASKTTYFGAIYNSSSARWEIVAISQEV